MERWVFRAFLHATLALALLRWNRGVCLYGVGDGRRNRGRLSLSIYGGGLTSMTYLPGYLVCYRGFFVI